MEDLAQKVAWLRQPGAYADATRRVEAIETHFSWIFLTDTRAYKLKKPVRREHFDYSSAELRRRYCDEEVRLNRRLAPDVYLGVRPLLDAVGGFELSSCLLEPDQAFAGDAADWLVTMRRLPRRRALDRLILNGHCAEPELADAALLLARFYERARRVDASGEAYRRKLENRVLRYRHELDDRHCVLGVDSLDSITDFQLECLRGASELFEARASARRIVDGHGDLRPEHIFLTPDPVVIDCLEFDAELRTLDSASELSFLLLECTRLGARAVGEAFLNVYTSSTGDRLSRRLIDFYQSHHACMRAVVALWHLDDPSVNTRSKWIRKARSYLALAAELARNAPRA